MAMTTAERLQVAIQIAERCRKEGRAARQAGAGYYDNPYGAVWSLTVDLDRELERVSWLDGWPREAAAESPCPPSSNAATAAGRCTIEASKPRTTSTQRLPNSAPT